MPFSSQREAKRFLVGKIAREAEIEGNPLTESEKRLLLFSEEEPDTVTGLAEDSGADFDLKYEKRMIPLPSRSRRSDRAATLSRCNDAPAKQR